MISLSGLFAIYLAFNCNVVNIVYSINSNNTKNSMVDYAEENKDPDKYDYPDLSTIEPENSANGKYVDQPIKQKSIHDLLVTKIGSISTMTDRLVYIEGDLIGISGKAYDPSPDPYYIPIEIIVRNLESNAIVYKITTLGDNLNSPYGRMPGVSYNEAGLNIGEAGAYNITATAKFSDGSQRSASTVFKVSNIFMTKPALISYIGIASFAVLAFIIARGLSNQFLFEIIRFICLSVIALTPIAALVFTEVQIGTTAPIGIVQIPAPAPTGLSNTPLISESANSMMNLSGIKQWAINIGGYVKKSIRILYVIAVI
jgi:hypothetical protein